MKGSTYLRLEGYGSLSRPNNTTSSSTSNKGKATEDLWKTLWVCKVDAHNLHVWEPAKQFNRPMRRRSISRLRVGKGSARYQAVGPVPQTTTSSVLGPRHRSFPSSGWNNTLYSRSSSSEKCKRSRHTRTASDLRSIQRMHE